MKRKVIGKIYSTTDYDSFKYREDNRPVNTNNKDFKELLDSIEKIGQKQPVIVDLENYIIDGQHRVAAAKQLFIPVEFVINEEKSTTNDLIQLQIKKEWNISNRAKSFSLSDENYEWYNVFSKKFPEFSHTIILMLLCGTPERVKKIEQDFKIGNFKIKSFGNASIMGDTLRKFGHFYKGYKKRGFVAAILTMNTHKDFDLQRMLRKMPIRAKSLMDFSRTEDYVEVLEEMYNWKETKKVYFKRK
jgi:hypothetical protein